MSDEVKVHSYSSQRTSSQNNSCNALTITRWWYITEDVMGDLKCAHNHAAVTCCRLLSKFKITLELCVGAQFLCTYALYVLGVWAQTVHLPAALCRLLFWTNTCSSVFPQNIFFVRSRVWTKDWVSGEGAGKGRGGWWVMGRGLEEGMMGGSLQGTAGWLTVFMDVSWGG